MDNTELFKKYCREGNLIDAKQLYQSDLKIDISACDEYALRFACSNGHLEVAKWLITIKLIINVSVNNQYAFRGSCENGHLEVAKWLITIKPTIDICDADEHAFKYACYNGHLEVAKWLLSIKPSINVSANNEFVFLEACDNDHLDVVQWLQSLYPDKYALVVENNKIISYCVKRTLPFNTNVIELKYTNKEELVCPICYNEETLIEVQTSCGHNFCNTCITNYYNKCEGDCKCPYCRQIITSFNKLELN